MQKKKFQRMICSGAVLLSCGMLFVPTIANAEAMQTEAEEVILEDAAAKTAEFGKDYSHTFIIDQVTSATYKYQVTERGYLSIKAKSTTDDSLNYTIYNEEGEQIYYCLKEKAIDDSYIPVMPGTYYLKVTPWNYSGTGVASMSFTKSDEWESGKNNSIETADPLTFGKKVMGIFTYKNYADFYAINVEEPGYFTISFNPENGFEPEDITRKLPYEIFDKNGKAITEQYLSWNYVKGGMTTEKYAMNPGTYYVSLANQDINVSENIYSPIYNYSITANFEKSDAWESEGNDDGATADLIALDKTYFGNTVTRNDAVDNFRFTAATAGVYSFDIELDRDTFSGKRPYVGFEKIEGNKETLIKKFELPEAKNHGDIALEAGDYYFYVYFMDMDDFSYQFQVKAPALSPVEQFVTRLYNICLNRSPEAAGLSDWVNKLMNKEASGASAAAGFFASDEFKAKGVSDEDYVEYLYKAFMDRASDPNGKEGWVNALKAGVSRMDVCEGFAASAEFKNICKTYGIAANDMELPNGGVRSFVVRLYRVCLDREADDNGLNSWMKQLIDKTISGKTAAHGFVFSPEFVSRNFDNEQYLEHLYQAFMGRPSDPSGKQFWMNKMNAGATREDVFNGFASSVEFGTICTRYGIDRE